MINELFWITLVIYSLVYVLCIVFQFYNHLRFKRLITTNNVISFLDSFYEIAIYIVGFLFMTLYISSIIDFFLYAYGDENLKFPFIVYAVPLMVASFRILVKDGLYAYNSNKIFIGGKITIEWADVTIEKIYKYTLINRAKIIITTDKTNMIKDRKFVIRTSLSNMKTFSNTINMAVK